MPKPVLKNIYILDYQPGFEEQIKADLQKIAKNPIGKRLIEKITASARLVFITYSDKASDCIPLDLASFIDPEKGSGSIIHYASSARFKVYTDQLQPLEVPNFIDLVHELIHAHHNLRGKNAQTNLCDKVVWSNDEEYHTIMGFPSKKPHRQTPKITENAFRIAQGLLPRFGHFGVSPLEDDPVLASESIQTLAKVFFENKILYQIVPPPIRNLTAEDLLPVRRTDCAVLE